MPVSGGLSALLSGLCVTNPVVTFRRRAGYSSFYFLDCEIGVCLFSHLMHAKTTMIYCPLLNHVSFPLWNPWDTELCIQKT